MIEAKHVLDAARDFRVASEMMGSPFDQEIFPVRSSVVTAAFAIELYLKFFAAFHNCPTQRGHKLRALYDQLPDATRLAVSRAYEGDGEVEDVLESHEGVFESWRYIYEHQHAPLSLDFRSLRLLANALEVAATQFHPSS